jgi:ABC-type sugar transport system permease subunit
MATVDSSRRSTAGTALPSGARPYRRPIGVRLKRILPSYLFITPAVSLLVLFSLISVLFSLYISFRDYSILSPDHVFVGLKNYRKALGEPLVRLAFRNTATYVIAFVPSVTIGSLTLAVLGNQIVRGRTLYRILFFIPSIVPVVVTSILWIWVYEPNGGLNRVLRVIGLDGPNWLMTPSLAMLSVVIMSVWMGLGYNMVIFMAGLADIPEVYYEAARVDGASHMDTFWYITLPLLRNAIIFVMVTLTIGAFQVFTQVYIMTRGGPMDLTQTVQYIIFREGFLLMKMGYAASISWMLFAIIFFFSALQLKLFVSERLYS